MATYILVDMDDTLELSGGRVNERVARFLDAEHEAGKTIAIVSGRQIRRLAETRAWLERHGIEFDEIHLSDFPAGPNAAAAFKLYKAGRILEQRGDTIALAIDDDATARDGYRSLGIEALSPSRVPEVDSDWTDEATEEEDDNGR